MAQDPRLALVDRVNERRAENARLADIERRLKIIERQNVVVQTTSGTPSIASRNGTLAADASPKLWVRVGNAWHWVGLT